MQDIKFRVWDRLTKSMKTITDISWTDNSVGCLDSFSVHKRLEFPKDCILLQYTNFKDMNGKEIYEGDIIAARYNHITMYTTGYFQIKKLDELYGAYGYIVDTHFSEGYPESPREDDFIFTPLMPHANDVEVVGNIYEKY